MSESQSRYSIIERLTNTKLSLLGENENLDREIIQAQNNAKYLEKEQASLKEELTRKMEQTLRQKEQEVERAKDEVLIAKQKKEEVSKTISAKIAEIDRAIKSVEEVSKSATIQETL